MAYLNRDAAALGWTYLIQGVDGGPVKIGRTFGDPEVRFKGIQANSPVRLRIVALIFGANFEAELHDRFATKRLHFEWFDESVIDEITADYPSDFSRRNDARRLIAESMAS